MKHAGDETLDQLDDLLQALSALPGRKEKKRGTYYRRPKAFIHFHEDPAGLFADVRLSGREFERVEVTSSADRAALLARIRDALA